MSVNSVADGFYRIRQAGAKSDIANSISNGKKCHYVQIGIELTACASLESAQEFVEGKGLEADPMSLDFGVKADPPAPEAGEDEAANAATEEAATEE